MLVDTHRPFLLASGVAGLAPGRPATEDDASTAHGPDSPRGGSENLALELVECGVHSVSLRFAPTVHGTADHDAARLVALDLEKAPASARLHAVAEQGISAREIAEAIGRAFDLPVASIAADDVADHFGWIGAYFAMDFAATSTATRELLGWMPTGPRLVEDIDAGAYSGSAR